MPVFIASLAYDLIKILNHSLDPLYNLNLRVVIIKEEFVFYRKYIDWDSANKWGYEDHLIRGRINSFWE